MTQSFNFLKLQNVFYDENFQRLSKIELTNIMRKLDNMGPFTGFKISPSVLGLVCIHPLEPY